MAPETSNPVDSFERLIEIYSHGEKGVYYFELNDFSNENNQLEVHLFNLFGFAWSIVVKGFEQTEIELSHILWRGIIIFHEYRALFR